MIFWSAFGLQEAPRVKKSKILELIRDALGGVGGSSLSMFKGFSKKIEKLKIQKLKIDQKWSAFGLQEAPGGLPRAKSEKKKLLEMEPDKCLHDF